MLRDEETAGLAYAAPSGLQRSLIMRLTPSELDRLTIFTAAELARRRRAKGWPLTYPEALALICDEMHEAARGGASYEEVRRVGQSTLSANDVLEGVAELIGTIKIAKLNVCLEMACACSTSNTQLAQGKAVPPSTT